MIFKIFWWRFWGFLHVESYHLQIWKVSLVSTTGPVSLVVYWRKDEFLCFCKAKGHKGCDQRETEGNF
jgi:hypothetical protein